MTCAWFCKILARTAALCLFAASVALHTVPAAAQGATGGSIGKQDKSISGGDEGGSSRSTSREHERERERPSRRERSSHRERGGGGGGGGGNFDGQWSVASVGKPCGAGQAAMGISGGRIVSNTFSGSVSGGGSIHGSFAANGRTGNFHGHLSGSSGSGSFTRSDGCNGSFSMVKQ
jgi:hypothetical protein